MSDVTVIGLGAMGSAIANEFLNAGHDVTVWNRGPEKTEPLRASGVQCADSPAEFRGALPRRMRPRVGGSGVRDRVPDDHREEWLRQPHIDGFRHRPAGEPTSRQLDRAGLPVPRLHSSIRNDGWYRDPALAVCS